MRLRFMPATLGLSNATTIESALPIQGLSDEVELVRGGDAIMVLVVAP